MNCEILQTLYIRSNGDVPCNDDAGERIILGQIAPDRMDWTIAELLHNAQYARIRDALQQGRPPWPEACPTCAFFRPGEAYTDGLAHQQVRKLQVEPSLACRLRCPCCSNAIQIKTRPRPFFLPVDLFERALRGLQQAGFTVGEIEYCGQGEPLLHPDFPRFVEVGRGYFPAARQRLITSGNFNYAQATGGRRLDEIFVSCDGLFQQNYAQYRVRGQVDQVIQFMKDVPKQIAGQAQILVWKYILFEFNDSDDEIYQAQLLAQEIGVDTMLFVFTHSDYKSRRYTVANVASFPIYFPNVTTNATPVHYQNSATPQAPPIPLTQVEAVHIAHGQQLEIRGWALSRERVSTIRVLVDGQVVGQATLGQARPDVFARHPEFNEAAGGFLFAGMLPAPLSGEHEIGLLLFSQQQPLKAIYRLYNFSS